MDQISSTTPTDAPAQAQNQSQPVDGAPSPEPPGFRSRGHARRRARFLRKARELAYRDLGGLVFNLHRFGQRNDALVLAKLTTLAHIDAELRALEGALEERRPVTVLREAGITACPRCAAIHSSEDSFCPNCGLSMGRHVDLPAGFQSAAGAAAPTAAPAPTATPASTGAAAPAPAPAPAPARPPAPTAPRTPAPSACSRTRTRTRARFLGPADRTLTRSAEHLRDSCPRATVTGSRGFDRGGCHPPRSSVPRCPARERRDLAAARRRHTRRPTAAGAGGRSLSPLRRSAAPGTGVVPALRRRRAHAPGGVSQLEGSGRHARGRGRAVPGSARRRPGQARRGLHRTRDHHHRHHLARRRSRPPRRPPRGAPSCRGRARPGRPHRARLCTEPPHHRAWPARSGLLHLTSPRAGKSKTRSFSLGRAVEERLRKVGQLPGAGTK